MRYSLDAYPTIGQSLVFWIGKFVKFKINTLSHSKITDKNEVSDALSFLNTEPTNIEDIDEIVRRLRRKANFDGVKTFYLPVKAFYEYATENMNSNITSLRQFDDEIIVDFLTSKTNSVSDATKTNYKNAIVNFFSFLSKNNETEEGSGVGYIYHLELSKWQGLSGKSGKKDPDYLNEDEISLFFTSLDTLPELFSSDRSSLFYNLLLRIILFTGVRISEAVGIEKNKVGVSKINNDEFLSFHIKGKGNYNRKMMVKKSLLEPYYSRWTRENSTDGLLFTSPSNPLKKVNTSSVSIKISSLLDKIGIIKNKKGAHLFRHTYGTLLYDKTKDLALVQDMLGHEDPNTTRVYTHIDNDRKLKAGTSMENIIPSISS